MSRVKRNYTYAVGDIANALPNWTLTCTKAGTTSTDIINIQAGTIIDGTCEWNCESTVGGGSGEGVVTWEEDKDYKINTLTIQSNNLYVCIQNHISSSSFENDVASGKWALVGTAGSSGESQSQADIAEIAMPGDVFINYTFTPSGSTWKKLDIIAPANGYYKVFATAVSNTTGTLRLVSSSGLEQASYGTTDLMEIMPVKRGDTLSIYGSNLSDNNAQLRFIYTVGDGKSINGTTRIITNSNNLPTIFGLHTGFKKTSGSDQYALYVRTANGTSIASQTGSNADFTLNPGQTTKKNENLFSFDIYDGTNTATVQVTFGDIVDYSALSHNNGNSVRVYTDATNTIRTGSDVAEVTARNPNNNLSILANRINSAVENSNVNLTASYENGSLTLVSDGALIVRNGISKNGTAIDVATALNLN